MMNHSVFYSFSKSVINDEDRKTLSEFYLPIMGVDANALYLMLIENTKSTKNYNIKLVNSIDSLLKNMNMSTNEFHDARKTLESLGLIKTYISVDEKSFIFQIIKPLAPNAFLQNKLLKSLLMKKIGEIRLETLIEINKTPVLDLSDYHEITAKFQDLFELDYTSLSTTREMELPTFTSTEEAIEGLSTKQFIKYLTNEYPNSTQSNRIDYLLGFGMSNSTLNLIINHSFLKNRAIIYNYVEAIVKDFNHKNMMTFIQVKNELSFANKTSETKQLSLINNDKDIEDVLKELLAN